MKGVLEVFSQTFNKLKGAKKNTKAGNKNISFIPFFETSDQTVEVNISLKSLLKILGVVALFWVASGVIVELREILTTTAIAFFFALALTPICSKLESYRIPRPLSIFLIYLLFFGGLLILFLQVIPIIGDQLFQLGQDLNHYFQKGNINTGFLKPLFEELNLDPQQMESLITSGLSTFAQSLNQVAGSTFDIITKVFKGFFNLIFTLVLIFFILLEREMIGNFFLSLFPKKDRQYLEEKTNTIQFKMSEWIKAQLILMVAVGVFMYLGMKVFEYFFGMKYAATIGIISGIMELFPYIGVTFSGIIVFCIALNISWTMVIAGLIWIGITQFLEGNFLVPVVMEKVVGLSSVATILALAAGGTLGYSFGGIPMMIMGMVLSIPLAATFSIFIQEYAAREAESED